MIRQAVPADLDEIEQSYQEHFLHERLHGAYTVFQEGIYPTRRHAEQALADGALYVYEEAGAILGSVILDRRQPQAYQTIHWPSSAPKERVGVIHLLMVRPSAAGRGIGAALVGFGEEEARRLGCLALRLDTGAQNTPAAALYQKLGFRLAAAGSMRVGAPSPIRATCFLKKSCRPSRIEREFVTMRIVVKVGTSTLAHATGRLNIRHVEELVKVLSDLKNAGHEMILVSSGAIGMGVGKLNLPGRPADMPTKQAAAAVGQCELMYTYDKLFSQYNHTVAQILLTSEDVDHDDRRQNFENTMARLLELGALPIINENDTVATAEIKVGDNDTLGAIVACSVKADLLVLLSDIEGLYTADPRQNPHAQLLPVVEAVTPDIEALAGGKGSELATGGMATKLRAAKMVTAQGCDMVITNGEHPERLYDIAEGRAVGTRFLGAQRGA